MNFEVRGGKTYKGVGCQDLGSNWERIESIDELLREGMGAQVQQQLGKN
jgi:hypothetical protein